MKTLKTGRKKIFISALHSLALLAMCYALWNLPYTFSSEAGFIKKINICKRFFIGRGAISGDILPVNSAYDRELVPFYDEMGVPAGEIDVTDRAKLLELFRYIAEENSHKYIVCDIFFDASLRTSSDDSLFGLMATIPRLVVPVHENGKNLPASLRSKAARADYRVNAVEENMLKYQYLQRGEKSLPLFMWTELTGGTFEKHCPFYRMNGKIATNSAILDLKTEIRGTYNSEGVKNYMNLGSDMLEMLRDTKPKNFFRDKIILIGDLCENDIHATTVGAMPGILINYNAFRMLEDGKLVISAPLCLLLFAVFFLMSLMTFFDKDFFKNILRKSVFNRDAVLFVADWVKFSLILSGLNLLTYFIWGRFIEIFMLSTYFTLLKTFLKIYTLIKRKKNEKNINDNGNGSCLPVPSGAERHENRMA